MHITCILPCFSSHGCKRKTKIDQSECFSKCNNFATNYLRIFCAYHCVLQSSSTSLQYTAANNRICQNIAETWKKLLFGLFGLVCLFVCLFVVGEAAEAVVVVLVIVDILLPLKMIATILARNKTKTWNISDGKLVSGRKKINLYTSHETPHKHTCTSIRKLEPP